MSAIAAVHLADYRVPDFLVDTTSLRFELGEACTRVSSRLAMRRNPDGDATAALFLHGEKQRLLSLSINGRMLADDEYRLTDDGLRIATVPERFELVCVSEMDPAANTELEGLYLSNGMYCTQCEAEGFRKITYYPDRPDVMSVFDTTLVADAGRFSVMLSNGNCLSDEIVDGKRVVHWQDPFPKPCYLFALVAGNLDCLRDAFVTASGRRVSLEIYADSKDIDKCGFAMQSLKKAMRWDEQVYGREYDLDRFMIVAVDHFNMGAMENKGLNIFNTSCVLAHPSTTTDAGFQRVEAVVAHEYFHNWSGNRVTCRDWFQLSLKEGFTVLRDAQFSADMNSAPVKRIEDVSLLRSLQFVEDAGPMAHPVQPQSYIEIANFYTLTIYEKGAEVVRMLAQLLGPVQFRQACDLYFSRHDGQAVTCEHFVRCMEEVSGRDLGQFRLWYRQAGTPTLVVRDSYDAQQKRYSLTVRQQLPAVAGDQAAAMHIPLKVALYGEQGALELHCNGETAGKEMMLDITRAEQEFVFEQLAERPVPSLLRDFSAPVKIDYPYHSEQLARLIVLDDDGFCRWDAMQSLQLLVLRAMVDGDPHEGLQQRLLEILGQLLQQADHEDPALLALMLGLPTARYLADSYAVADPAAIDAAVQALADSIAMALQLPLRALYQRLQGQATGLCASAMAARSLRNRALACLLRLDHADDRALAMQQFSSADNMTDQLAAMTALVHSPYAAAEAEQVLQAFYRQWSHERLVVNMWLQVQASRPQADALQQVQRLLSHPAFDAGNPNCIRALVGGFCQQNFAAFHAADGGGYRFLAEQVALYDRRNPQIAARLLAPLTHWRRYEPARAALMQQALQGLQASAQSKDVLEVLGKSLAPDV